MRSTSRAATLCFVAAVAGVAVTAPAAAAPKRITGTLSEAGYTVVALAANGKARLVEANGGEFSVRPPAARVTLHLRAPNGKYGGPIVVGRAGRRALVGVKAGARLGTVSVQSGYARVTRRLPKRWLDAGRVARARRGIPLGARVFGRVRSRPPRRSIRADRDLDGVPNVLDIDDDGDLAFDDVDRSRAARAAQAGEDLFGGFSVGLTGELNHALNANATGVSPQDIDALLSTRGGFDFFESFPRGGFVELDCSRDTSDDGRQGLPYCSPGDPPSTGRVQPNRSPLGPRETWPRFPDDFDPPPNNNGFGTVSGPGAAPGFLHGATTSQIGTGDELTFRFATGDTITTVLQFIPVTFPALVSYDDGRGHFRAVSYPVPGPDPETGAGANQPCDTGTNCAGPGTRGNPFPVRARDRACPRNFCRVGDVVLTLTFWRPQRARVAGDPQPGPGDSPTWTDIGGLKYGVSAGPSLECWPEDFTSSDPHLVFYEGEGREPGAEPGEDAGIIDRPPDPPDKPANPANTFTYTLNLTRCLGRPQDGLPPGTFTPGETTQVEFVSGKVSGGLARGGSRLTVFFKAVP